MTKKKIGFGDSILAFLLGAILLVVTAQILWRYVFNRPLIWTEEASRYLFVWMTFIAAAVAVGQKLHVRVTVFLEGLPKSGQRILHIVSAILTIVYFVFLVIVGIEWLALNDNVDSPAMRLPLNYALYASLPVGCLIGVGVGLRQLLSGKAATLEDHELESSYVDKPDVMHNDTEAKG